MHTERGSLGAAAGILGLLICVAIILYLMVGPMGGGAGGGGAAGGGGGGGGTSYLGAVKGARDQGFEVKIETLAYSLDQMITAHVLANDDYPKSLDELGAHPSAFADPWGNNIEYTIDEVNKELTVTSGGPDGQIGTADDIMHTRPLSL